jgi:hypothetical protein
MDVQDFQIENPVLDILKYVEQWCHPPHQLFPGDFWKALEHKYMTNSNGVNPPSSAMNTSQFIPPTTFSCSASSSRITTPLHHTEKARVPCI